MCHVYGAPVADTRPPALESTERQLIIVFVHAFFVVVVVVLEKRLDFATKAGGCCLSKFGEQFDTRDQTFLFSPECIHFKVSLFRGDTPLATGKKFLWVYKELRFASTAVFVTGEEVDGINTKQELFKIRTVSEMDLFL